jgi:hypothetical protein
LRKHEEQNIDQVFWLVTSLPLDFDAGKAKFRTGNIGAWKTLRRNAKTNSVLTAHGVIVEKML